MTDGWLKTLALWVSWGKVGIRSGLTALKMRISEIIALELAVRVCPLVRSLFIFLLPCLLMAQNPAHEWSFMDSTRRRIVLETRQYGIDHGYPELGAHAAHESRGDTSAINYEDPKDPYDDCACELQVAVRFPTIQLYGKDFTAVQFEAVKDSLIVFREF